MVGSKVIVRGDNLRNANSISRSWAVVYAQRNEDSGRHDAWRA